MSLISDEIYKYVTTDRWKRKKGLYHRP